MFRTWCVLREDSAGALRTGSWVNLFDGICGLSGGRGSGHADRRARLAVGGRSRTFSRGRINLPNRFNRYDRFCRFDRITFPAHAKSQCDFATNHIRATLFCRNWSVQG